MGDFLNDFPIVLWSLGGQYRGDYPFLGSLYLFGRSSFQDQSLPDLNKLGGRVSVGVPSQMLLLARLGHRMVLGSSQVLEIGLRLQLPINPAKRPYFQAADSGYLPLTPTIIFGSHQRASQISFYLEGSF